MQIQVERLCFVILVFVGLGSACHGDMLRPLSPLDHVTSVSLSILVGSKMGLEEDSTTCEIFYGEPQREQRFQDAVSRALAPALHASGIALDNNAKSEILVYVYGHGRRENDGSCDQYVYLVAVDAYNAEVEPEEYGEIDRIIGLVEGEALEAVLANTAIEIVIREIEGRVAAGEPRSYLISSSRFKIVPNASAASARKEMEDP